jgi:hypothetical protein
VAAHKEGLCEAQSLLRSLNMAPSTIARNKTWFLQPWLFETADKYHWAYVPAQKPTPGEDGDGEVLRDTLTTDVHGGGTECSIEEGVLEDTQNADFNVFDDGVDPLVVAESEYRDAIVDMLNHHESLPGTKGQGSNSKKPISQVVEYSGKFIFKSTLISELNGNPFLSKDRLTCISNSIYFNNAEDYLGATSSQNSCLMGLGSDCGVFFVTRGDVGTSSAVNVARKRN